MHVNWKVAIESHLSTITKLNIDVKVFKWVNIDVPQF